MNFPLLEIGRDREIGLLEKHCGMSLAEIEKRHILRVLASTGGNKTRAAKILGIDTKTLYNKLKAYKLQDLEWKYALLTQTRSGSMPVSLSYHGNAVLDARDAKYFGPEEDYQFAYRMSYLNQLILSRRFGNKTSLQFAPTFVYYNAVPEGYNNANASLYFGGRFQVLGFSSIIADHCS